MTNNLFLVHCVLPKLSLVFWREMATSGTGRPWPALQMLTDKLQILMIPDQIF